MVLSDWCKEYLSNKIQDYSLTRDKVLNSLIYTIDHLSKSSYTRATNFWKWSSFYGPAYSLSSKSSEWQWTKMCNRRQVA